MVCVSEKSNSLFLPLCSPSLVLWLKLQHNWTQTKFILLIHIVLVEEKALRVKVVRCKSLCAHSVSGVVVESIPFGKRFLQLNCGCLCI
jgi:hypothetical protein